MTDIGTSAGRSAAFAGQRIAATLLGVQDAIDTAEAETRNSRLPGRDSGGPGNAYKHLLITGELYRRRGPTFGPTIAELRELANDALGQSDDDADMDRTNNAIVVNERPDFKTWEDVVEWARAKIVEAAAHDGDGENGRAAWYEKQPPHWQTSPAYPSPRSRRAGPSIATRADRGSKSRWGWRRGPIRSIAPSPAGRRRMSGW